MFDAPVDDFTMILLAMWFIIPLTLLTALILLEICRAIKSLYKSNSQKRSRYPDIDTLEQNPWLCTHCGKVLKPGDVAFSVDMARGNGRPVCKECDNKYKVVYDRCDQEGGVYQYHWEDR